MARTFYMLIHTKKRGANSVTRSTCRGSGIAQFAETSNANTTSNLMQHLKRQENVRKC